MHPEAALCVLSVMLRRLNAMIESTLEMPTEASVGASNAGTAATDHADVPLSRELLRKINAYWRAPTISRVGQIYLYEQSAAERTAETVSCETARWWATGHHARPELHLCSSQSVIKKYDLDMFYIAGPGHGGPAIVGNDLPRRQLERDLSERHQDEAGLKSCSSSSRFPEAFPATLRRPPPGRFTRAESWGTRSAMPSGRRSIIPI